MKPSLLVTKNRVVVTAVFLLALTYRLHFFPHNIYFGFDQARDAFISSRIIAQSDILLWGPPTDISGVYHGPLYYYLIGPFYLLSHGEPWLPIAINIVINATGVFLTYLIGRDLANKKTGLISAFLFAISFEQYQYSYYAVDPAPGVISTLIFYYGCVLFFLRKKPIGLLLVSFGLATAIHFEFFLIYLVLILPIFFVSFRPKPSKHHLKYYFSASLIFLLLISNYLVAEFKYGWRTTKALANFAAEASSQLPPALDKLTVIFEKYVNHIFLNFFGLSHFFSAILLVCLLLYVFRLKKISSEFKFLLIWIGGPLLLYLGNIGTVNYFMTNIGVAVGLALLVAVLLTRQLKSPAQLFFVISLILLGNLKLLLQQGNNGLVWGLLAVQDGMLLRDQQALIDYTYQTSAGQPFQIKTLTMPLKIQTTWAYLYQQYGQSKYHYLPQSFWDDVPGFEGSFPKSNQPVCTRYSIIEPTRGLAPWFIDEFHQLDQTGTKFIGEKQFGKLTLRIYHLTNCDQAPSS